MKYIIANWKAQMNRSLINDWWNTFSQHATDYDSSHVTIILCPPHPYIAEVAWKVAPALAVGSQDVSQFTKGTHTGEVTAEMLKDVAHYCIIGHSERRQQLHETEEMLMLKVQNTLEAGLIPIYCIQNESEKVPDGVKIVAYEPPTAISTGDGNGATADLNSVLRCKSSLITSSPEVTTFIYGGSINEENASEFLHDDAIDGILVGGASLSAERFIKICNAI